MKHVSKIRQILGPRREKVERARARGKHRPSVAAAGGSAAAFPCSLVAAPLASKVKPEEGCRIRKGQPQPGKDDKNVRPGGHEAGQTKSPEGGPLGGPGPRGVCSCALLWCLSLAC